MRTLRNAISTDRVAHAYLFTGTKGTGKTTLAKLLAKAMNCEQGPTPDPCGECEQCRAIAEGRSMDVAEIDAASSRGIDAVREKIIETVAFQPSSGTRRVYILDEAHQLTKEAFNALLKTIEEPPPHVLFVFCTTEGHQMMATVRDRCQRLALTPPGADELLAVLARVCENEGIQADESALRAVTRVAQGSFRNALGTLEMLATAYGQSFSHADVLAHLGAVSEDVLHDVAVAIHGGQVGAVLVALDQLVASGGDVEQFSRELAEYIRAAVLVRHGIGASSLGIGDAARLESFAGELSEQQAVATIDCLADAATRIRVGSDSRLTVEVAMVRAAQGLGLPSLALRLAAIEQKQSGAYGQPLATAAVAAPVSAPAAPVVEAPVPVASAPQPPAASPQPAPAATAPASNTSAWWDSFLASAATDAPLRPVIAGMRLESAGDDRIVVASGAPIVTDRMVASLTRHLHAVVGGSPRLEVVTDRAAAAPAPAEAEVAVAAPVEAAPTAVERVDAPGAAQPDEPVAPIAAPAPDSEAAVAAPAAGDDALALFQQAFDATEVAAE